MFVCVYMRVRVQACESAHVFLSITPKHTQTDTHDTRACTRAHSACDSLTQTHLILAGAPCRISSRGGRSIPWTRPRIVCFAVLVHSARKRAEEGLVQFIVLHAKIHLDPVGIGVPRLLDKGVHVAGLISTREASNFLRSIRACHPCDEDRGRRGRQLLLPVTTAPC